MLAVQLQCLLVIELCLLDIALSVVPNRKVVGAVKSTRELEASFGKSNGRLKVALSRFQNCHVVYCLCVFRLVVDGQPEAPSGEIDIPEVDVQSSNVVPNITEVLCLAVAGCHCPFEARVEQIIFAAEEAAECEVVPYLR